MRGKCLDVHGLGLALGHYCGSAPIDPFEKRGDDSQRLDNSNAKVHDDMNL